MDLPSFMAMAAPNEQVRRYMRHMSSHAPCYCCSSRLGFQELDKRSCLGRVLQQNPRCQEVCLSIGNNSQCTLNALFHQLFI